MMFYDPEEDEWIEYGEMYYEGRPLSEVGLENAKLILSDGRQVKFEGFVVRDGQTLMEAILEVIPPGSMLSVAPRLQ